MTSLSRPHEISRRDRAAPELYRKNCVEIGVDNEHELVQTITAHALGFTATTTVTFTE